MTEKEIISLQNDNEGIFYLIKVGMFYQAYGNGAFALSRVTGYRVREKLRKKSAPILVCGFPLNKLSDVLSLLKSAGASIEDEDNLIKFSGVDGSSDGINVQKAESISMKNKNKEIDLQKLILSFDLSNSIPMDAMNFIAKLQKQIKEI